jgi:hypothetical protein
MNDLSNIPAGSHLLWLQSEVERLDTLLRPASRSQIGDRLKIMFAAMSFQDKGVSDDLRAQAYIYALDGVPLSVLDGVMRDVLQGRVDGIDLIFAPTPPQLAKVCRERTEDMQHIRFKRSNEGVQERLKMLPAPAPPVMTPEEAEAAQRRIDAKVEAAKASIIADVAGDRWAEEKASATRKALDEIAKAARERGHTL